MSGGFAPYEPPEKKHKKIHEKIHPDLWGYTVGAARLAMTVQRAYGRESWR